MDIIQTMDVIVTKVELMMTRNKELANHILDQLVIKSLTMDMRRCKEASAARATSLSRITVLQAKIDMRRQVEKSTGHPRGGACGHPGGKKRICKGHTTSR